MATKGAKTARKGPAALARELSEFFGITISRQQVYAWLKRGLPVENPAALQKVLELQRGGPGAIEPKGATGGEGEEISLREQLLLEQIRKTRVEADLKEIQHEVELGRYRPAAEVEEEGVRLGALVKSFLLQLPEILPPMIEGMAAERIRPKVRAEVIQILGEIERAIRDL